MADDVALKSDDNALAGGISDASAPTDKPAADPTATKSPSAARKEAPSQQQPAEPGPAAEPNETAEAVKQLLKLKSLDPHFEEMLRVAQLRLTKDQAGLLIDMPQNGHTIHCGKAKEGGGEFIGLSHKSMIVDEHDAHLMIGLAKARGWSSINVNGNKQEQELLWLEAMRQGLKVANFQPDPNSEAAMTWANEWAALPKPVVSEAKEEDFHVKTMQLLQEKAAAAQDKDVKAGLETVLKKFQDGTDIHGTADIHKQLASLLSDKDERAGYNLAVEALNKAEPKLGLTALAAPVAAPAAAAADPKPAQPAPATPSP
jgi:hypothetical protein